MTTPSRPTSLRPTAPKPIAKEQMSAHVRTISVADTLQSAWLSMKENGIRHLPVYDQAGFIVGMLSDRDVKRGMVSIFRRNSALGLPEETISFHPEARVRDYMTWPVECVEVSTELDAVANHMLAGKISSVLVTEGEAVRGILTSDDLLKVLVDLLRQPKSSLKLGLPDLLDRAQRALPDFSSTIY